MKSLKNLTFVLLSLLPISINAQNIIETSTSGNDVTQPMHKNAVSMGFGVKSTNYFAHYPLDITIALEHVRPKASAEFLMSYANNHREQALLFTEGIIYTYKPAERVFNFDFLLKYNFLKPSSRSRLSLGAGAGFTVFRFHYLQELTWNYDRFEDFRYAKYNKSLFTIPLLLEYQYKVRPRLMLGVRGGMRWLSGFEGLSWVTNTYSNSGIHARREITSGEPRSSYVNAFVKYSF